MNTPRLIAATVVLSAVLAGAAAPAHAAYAIRGYVIGNGGTPSGGIESSGKKIHGTAGLAVVGKSTGSGRDLCHGFWCWGGTTVVSVDPPAEEIEALLPKTLAFGAPRPNPVQAAARFAVDLPRAARIDLRVLDVQGRLVRVVESGPRAAGFHGIAWDGCDESGARVGAGVYYARLVVEGVAIGTRRVVMRR